MQKIIVNKSVANNRKKIIYQYIFNERTKGILVAEPDKRDSQKEFYKLYLYSTPVIVDQQIAKLDVIKNIQWVSCIIEQQEDVYYLGNMLLQIEAQIEDGSYIECKQVYSNTRKTVQVVHQKYAENYWYIGKDLPAYHIKRNKSFTPPSYIQDNALLEKLAYTDPHYNAKLYSTNILIPDFSLDSYPEDTTTQTTFIATEIETKLAAGEYIWNNKE